MNLWAATPPMPYTGPLRAPRPQGDSFYGERVTRKPGGGKSPAAPLRSPSPPREKVSLRSPLSDGDNASSGTGVPIQEATTESRSPPWVLIDKPPGHQQSFCPRVSPPAVQPVGIINILLSTVQTHVPFRLGRGLFSFSPFHPVIKLPLDGRGSVAILVCGCSLMSEEYWRRVLYQDEWRAGSLGSTGKTDPCPLKRNASGNWGSRGHPP